MFRTKIALLGLALIFLVTGCKKDNDKMGTTTEVKETEELNLTPVTTITVESSDFNQYGEYYGRVKGVGRFAIISVMGGSVESVDVVEGSRVNVGDSLAKISSEKARLALESAKLNEKISRENYNTQTQFLKTGNSSQVKVDQSHLSWLQSKTQLIDSQKAYDAAFCIAQIQGTVVSRNVNRDQEINPGHESFLIEDLSKVEIEIGIPEADMEGVTEGSKAEITLDLYPNRVWNGVLTRHSRRSSDRNLTFSATILVDNEDGKILSGTTAKVKLLRNSYVNHIVLPTDTVAKEGDQSYVMILKDDVVNKRDIILGVSSVEEVVVLSGLTEGETVVQEGLHLLTDSQRVIVAGEGV